MSLSLERYNNLWYTHTIAYSWETKRNELKSTTWMNFKRTGPGFLNFATTDSGQINLYLGTFQMWFRKFRIIPGLYLQDASRALRVVTTKKCIQPLHYTMWKKPESAEGNTVTQGKDQGLTKTSLEVQLGGWEIFREKEMTEKQMMRFWWLL